MCPVPAMPRHNSCAGKAQELWMWPHQFWVEECLVCAMPLGFSVKEESTTCLNNGIDIAWECSCTAAEPNCRWCACLMPPKAWPLNGLFHSGVLGLLSLSHEDLRVEQPGFGALLPFVAAVRWWNLVKKLPLTGMWSSEVDRHVVRPLLPLFFPFLSLLDLDGTASRQNP